MKIALLGASGRVGQRITMEALVRGHEVKALVRKPERFPIAHPRLTVARVDIFDPTSVAEAIADSDVVMNATGAGGSDPGVQSGPAGPGDGPADHELGDGGRWRASSWSS